MILSRAKRTRTSLPVSIAVFLGKQVRDRRPNQLQESDAISLCEQMGRSESPIEWRTQNFAAVLPRIFTIIGPLPFSPHGGIEQLDFSRDVADKTEDSLHPFQVPA